MADICRWAGSGKRQPKAQLPPYVRDAMRYLGSLTSEKKKAAVRKNGLKGALVRWGHIEKDGTPSDRWKHLKVARIKEREQRAAALEVIEVHWNKPES